MALQAIGGAPPRLNALATVDQSGARAAARALERDPALGDLPLAGIPFAVKESEPVRGWRVTFGDPVGATRHPEAADSPAVARLRAAGAIPIGATNVALYEAWAETTNPLFGTTGNPWDLSRVPGGSSGGSAAAVAAGLVPFATASDGGGSIRIPAAACGLPGFKASLQLLPTDVALGEEGLAVRGALARSCADAALLLDILAGDGSGGFTAAARAGSLSGLRVAWSATYGYAQPDPRIVGVCEAALAEAAAAGAAVREISGPLDHDPLDVYAVLMVRALADAVERVRGDGSREGLPAMLRDWLGAARSVTDEDLARARSGRRAVAAALDAVFADHDVLVSPTTAELPPAHPHPDNEWVKFTHPINLHGGPAISIPVGTVVDGGRAIPVGMQVAGRVGEDGVVLAVGAALERALSLELRPPPLG